MISDTLALAPEWGVQVFREPTAESRMAIEALRTSLQRKVMNRGLELPLYTRRALHSTSPNLMLFEHSALVRNGANKNGHLTGKIVGEKIFSYVNDIETFDGKELSCQPDALYVARLGNTMLFGMNFGAHPTNVDTNKSITNALAELDIAGYGFSLHIPQAHIVLGQTKGYTMQTYREVNTAWNELLTDDERLGKPLDFGELRVEYVDLADVA